MSKLELKIPPVLLVALFALLMWGCAKLTPTLTWVTPLGLPLALTFILIGLVFGLGGVFSFRQAQTTVNPTKPETCSSLVTSGIFQYSRNPMYVGLLCLLLSWTSYLANPSALLGAIGFVLYMNRFQIEPEERALTKLFGANFKDYTLKVRRWL